MIKFSLLIVWVLIAPGPIFGLQIVGKFPARSNGTAPSGIDDLDVIRDRYAKSVLPVDSAAVDFLHTEGARFAKTLQPDGMWSDINYADSARSVWTTSDHLERILVMAKCARIDRNAGRLDNELEGKILIALRWWTDHDYHNPNWWLYEIGVPILLDEFGILMESRIPGEELAKLIATMKRSDWRGGSWTGANLTWGVTIEIARGCLENNPETVSEAYDRMYEEIKIAGPSEEGIQQDSTFHQHGHQLYNGGYGLDFANDVGRFISFAWGTRFQIPPDRMEIFSSFILDGEQWMVRGNVIDYSTVGREITRQGKVAVPGPRPGGPISPVGPEYSLGNVISMLAAEPTPRQKEFQAFEARLKEKADVPELIGNKQFWCSDFMAHRRAGYYASVKMLSTRMRNGELVNLEGRKSQHLSDGVNLLYLTGDEYKDIFPAWNWARLPGTTAIHGTLDTGEKDPIGATGITTFDGGVSDGTYGMAAMDLARGKLSAKKAWFFFDESYVALGAGISLENDAEHDVATDVNQLKLSGEILSSQSRSPVPPGTHAWHSGHPFWVFHDHVGYIFPGGEEVSESGGPQSGKWSEIGTGSSEPVTIPIFDLWIDHGRSPHDATYQYTVLPDVSAETVAARARNADLVVLSNTANVQAVYSRGLKLVEVAFRKFGELATPVGRIDADHSCLLLVRKTPGGWTVTASNPGNEPLTLGVTINGKLADLRLPGGNLAGSSIRADLR